MSRKNLAVFTLMAAALLIPSVPALANDHADRNSNSVIGREAHDSPSDRRTPASERGPVTTVVPRAKTERGTTTRPVTVPRMGGNDRH